MSLKRLYLSFFVISLVSLSHADVRRLSEPVAIDGVSETFGEIIDEWPSFVSLNDVLDKPVDYLGKPTSLDLNVTQVCQVKGCFFIGKQDEHHIRIAFKDYGFFVPTDIDGKRVSLVGELVQHELSEEQAKHFSQDLGKDGVAIKSGVVYEVVASAVRVFHK